MLEGHVQGLERVGLQRLDGMAEPEETIDGGPLW